MLAYEPESGICCTEVLLVQLARSADLHYQTSDCHLSTTLYRRLHLLCCSDVYIMAWHLITACGA